jgi:dethiobiotin synthase
MNKKGIFIAATDQHVGKTTLCLGLLSGLKKRYQKVGFLKPVGQEKVTINSGHDVDKDAVLFKEYFDLPASYQEMSPVLCPAGFTRDYLDQKVSEQGLLQQVQASWQALTNTHQFVVVEGTGHVGVGSLFNLNNARVAKELGLEIVLLATGGLGSAYDELSLNLELCKSQGVNVKGIILNKVLCDKRSMILEYFPKALKRWNIPLLGCIPFESLLLQPSMRDFEVLFDASLISGQTHRYRHFDQIRLVASSLETFVQEMRPNQLVITPACREDVIIATVGKHMRMQHEQKCDYGGGLILTGQNGPRDVIIERIRGSDLPILYAPVCSFEAMKKISSFTAKIRQEDHQKVSTAIALVEKYVNFDLLCE